MRKGRSKTGAIKGRKCTRSTLRMMLKTSMGLDKCAKAILNKNPVTIGAPIEALDTRISEKKFLGGSVVQGISYRR